MHTDLWRHPNGTWYVLYGPRLKRRISTRSRDRGPAETFRAQFVAGASAPVINEPTVGEILAGYKEDIENRNAVKVAELEGALARLEQTFGSPDELDHARALVANMRAAAKRSNETLKFNVAALTKHLGALKPMQLLSAVFRHPKTGYVKLRGVKPGTILREIGVLRAALAWAVEQQWIKVAPKISNPVATPRPRDRWLTRDEARKLIDACYEPHIKAFVILGLMTAARTGAILEARWSQVSFERRMIDYGIGHGNKRRVVAPLNDEAFRTLAAAKELACTDHVIEYHGRRVTAIKKGFRAACQRAGIKGVTPHILRHSAATWMAMDDVSMREIARLLGDTEETVERVYAKHSPRYLRRAASALQLSPKPAEGALQVEGGSPETSVPALENVGAPQA